MLVGSRVFTLVVGLVHKVTSCVKENGSTAMSATSCVCCQSQAGSCSAICSQRSLCRCRSLVGIRGLKLGKKMKAIYVDEANSSRLKRRLKTKCGLKEQRSSLELALSSTHHTTLLHNNCNRQNMIVHVHNWLLLLSYALGAITGQPGNGIIVCRV